MITKVYSLTSPGDFANFAWGMRKMSVAKGSRRVLDLAISVSLDRRKIDGLRYDSADYKRLRSEYGSSAAACKGMACALWEIEGKTNDD